MNVVRISRNWAIGALLLFGSGACATPRLPDRVCSLAIRNVTVLPMDSERRLVDQTVRIADGRIVSIDSTSLNRGPSCSRTIDGSGKYLMPGLNDMHIHVESRILAEGLGIAPEPIPFEDVLYLYLSHGVTGVRVMSGGPDILAFRDSSHGVAPRLLVSSPMLSGAPPVMPEPITRILETPEEAVEAVNTYADAGYDFIKIRHNLSRPVLNAVIETARDRGLDVDGHIPDVPRPLETGIRGVAHMNELSLRVRDRRTDPERFAQLLHDCRCYVTTTLTVDQNVPRVLRSYDLLAARNQIRFIHPLMRDGLWARDRNPYLAENPDPAFFDDLLETDMALVRALHARGVPLLAGTDALIPMIIPGDSLHDELALLVQAGLTPYQALQAATSTPSRIFPGFRDLGVLAPGRTANAILVSSDPFEKVDGLRRPDAVIVGGVFLSRAVMDARLETIAERFERR